MAKKTNCTKNEKAYYRITAIIGYDEGCTASQIQNAYKLLKMFLKYCVRENYIMKDPCLNVVMPGERGEKHEVAVFTNEEISRLKSTLQGHRLRLLILLALGTVLRLGELIALRYSDISQDGVI